MQSLQQLILRLGLASLGEINQAIFTCPADGLIRALGIVLGEKRENNILASLAAALGIDLLEEESLLPEPRVAETVLARLTPLARNQRVLPLRCFEEQGRSLIIVAAANPCDHETLQTIASVFAAEPQVCLAREAAILQAISRVEAISASGVDTAGRHAFADAPHPFSNEIGEREVEKTIHQVVATAVKHSAVRAEIDLDRPFIEVAFTFADGQKSAVEMSVDPWAFASGLFKRAQPIEWRSGIVRAVVRVEFRAVSIDFEMTLPGRLDQYAAIDESGQPGRSVVLEKFAVDLPEDPLFWLGISEQNAQQIRRVFSDRPGLVLVVSSDERLRKTSIRALSQTFSDSVCEELFPSAERAISLFEQAKNNSVVVGLAQRDIFSTFDWLQSITIPQRAAISALIGVMSLPRVCICCASYYEPDMRVLTLVRDYLGDGLGRFLKGRGCPLCGRSGFLGEILLSSVFSMREPAGELYRKAAPLDEVLAALADSDFSSFFEDGVLQAMKGRTTLETVLSGVSQPSGEYLSALRKRCGRPQLKSAEGAVAAEYFRKPGMLRSFEAIYDDKAAAKEPPGDLSSREHRPVTGRNVFLVREQTDIEDPGADSLLSGLDDEHQSDCASPVDTPSQAALLLVIDDDDDQRSILRRVFELAGYRVEVAANGMDGIVSAARLSPQLIIVDFMMPDMDGKETVRRLRASPTTADTPIMALTAFGDPDIEYGLLEAGADDFCPKSITKKVLLKRVDRLLARR